jgi:exopolysaccharide production protein ExoZ
VLRGIAATLVVAHHAFENPVRVGAAGVDLFFVISGFIMANCSRERTAVTFLADRAWRIFPLWLIAVTPWLLMKRETLEVVLTSLTLWPVYGSTFVSPALGVGWTLSYELLFYVGFALALATRPAVPILIFGICFCAGLATNDILFWFLGSPLALEFLLGVAIAQVPPDQRAGRIIGCLGLVCFALLPSTYYAQAFGHGAIYRVLFWGIPAAMLLYGARSIEERFASRAFDLPVLAGTASYSIYLFHQLVLQVLHGFTGLVASIIAGIAIYLCIERHIMRARSRSGKRGNLAVALTNVELPPIGCYTSNTPDVAASSSRA